MPADSANQPVQPMTQETAQIQILLRDLLASITQHHDRLKITLEEYADNVFWRVDTHLEDTGKIIGSGGTHLKSLNWILNRARLFFDDPKPHSLRIPAQEGPKAAPTRSAIAEQYDPAAAVKLLEDTLFAIGVSEFKIEAEMLGKELDGRLQWVLTVWVRDASDLALLTHKPDSGPDEMAAIGHVGTILRAGGRKDGISLRVAVWQTEG